MNEINSKACEVAYQATCKHNGDHDWVTYMLGWQAALEYARGKQEPVAWMSDWQDGSNVDFTTKPFVAATWVENDYPIQPLYTHPAQPVQPAQQQEPFTWAIEWWDKDGEYEVEYSTMGEFSFGRKGGFPLFRAAPAVAVNEKILEALKSVTKATDLTTYGMALNNARAAIRAAEAAKGGV